MRSEIGTYLTRANGKTAKRGILRASALSLRAKGAQMMHCKIKSCILIICVLLACVINTAVVFADEGEDDTAVNDQGIVTEKIPDGCFQLTFCLSSDLAGKTLDITNTASGENIGNVRIDSTGTGTVTVPVQDLISITFSSGTPSPNQTKKSEWNLSLSKTLLLVSIAVGSSAFIFYRIGKRRTMKKFDAALDIIYDEDLDD